jgi:DNA-binding CsgD family transcriptional regulator
MLRVRHNARVSRFGGKVDDMKATAATVTTTGVSISSEKENDLARLAQTLTRKEREMLELLSQGKSTKEIAAILSLCPETVADHRKHICKKLDVHSTAGLIARAISIGASSAKT